MDRVSQTNDSKRGTVLFETSRRFAIRYAEPWVRDNADRFVEGFDDAMRNCDAEKDQPKTESHRPCAIVLRRTSVVKEGPANQQTHVFAELLTDLRGRPDAPGGARGDAAGRRQVGGKARTSDVGFRIRLRRRLPLPPRAQPPRSPTRVHGRYCP
jgi:hypothetical protein